MVPHAPMGSPMMDVGSFMTFYTANHLQSRRVGGDPVQMTVGEWAAGCSQYVDPDSDLGKALASDPEKAHADAGLGEAAQYALSERVSQIDDNTFRVMVNFLGTQNSWSDTSTYSASYLVTVNDKGLVTNVEPDKLG